MRYPLERRKFLQIAGSGITLSLWLEQLVIAADVSAAGASVLDDSTNAGIRSLFESNNEEALALTGAVFRKCILEKIMQPTPPLKNTWIIPGGPYYKGQWIWDTMFVVDLLSILPGKKKLIRDIFQNYRDFQDRWNAKMPDYAQDMINVAIKTAPQEVRQFSQIPILVWGVERVYRRNGDKQQALERYLDQATYLHGGQNLIYHSSNGNIFLMELCDLYLKYQDSKVLAGEITPKRHSNQISIVRKLIFFLVQGRKIENISTLDQQN